MSLGLVIDVSKSYGEASAKNMSRLVSISNPGDNLQEIVIYKGNSDKNV
jgi:hypothetical protein